MSENIVDDTANEERLGGALDEAPQRGFGATARRRFLDLGAVGALHRRTEVRLEVCGDDVDLAERARLDAYVGHAAPERDTSGERLRIALEETRKRERLRRVDLRP